MKRNELRNDRSSDVTIQGLRIEDCKWNTKEALIHLRSVHNISLNTIEFFRNENLGGPSFLSGKNSTVTVSNTSVLKNSGKHGGVLGVASSKVNVFKSTIEGNKDHTSTTMKGGIFLLDASDLDVEVTEFMENETEDNGGVIHITVSFVCGTGY